LSKPRRARFVALADLLRHHRPDIDPGAITAGRVLIDGRVLTNPAARVRANAVIRVTPARRLRGDVKLNHALDTFDLPVDGRVALDLGASAGGFTTALLSRGARRVYAVDTGVGQLLGRLRADHRVVNLEGHNLGALHRTAVPDVVEVITMDLSYLAVADAVGQLEVVQIAGEADLVALVKPTFEFHRATVAASEDDIDEALDLAATSIDAARWSVVATCAAPPTGQRGAREVFIHAHRRTTR
jgi:23S rRNA (cytidine1920-2'-O)/16S rRNA (cytidine1409-2'-O)-methyltransferase